MNRLFPKSGLRIPARTNGNGNGKHASAADRKGLILSAGAEYFFDWSGKYQHLLPDITAQNAYRAFALTYAAMRYRATKFIEPQLWISEEVDGEEEWIEEEHPLTELLEQPNPDMTMGELLELVSLYLDATGRCLLVKNRDRGKRVASLYPFSGDEFTVEPAEVDGTRLLYGKFRVHTDRGNRPLGPNDVIFLRNVDPTNVLFGMAPLTAALSHVNIGNTMRAAVTAALKRVISPGGVVQTESKDASGATVWMPDDAFTRFKSEVGQVFGGAVNNGGVWLLENGEFQPFNSPLKEMALGPIQGDVETAVCMCFQLHPALLATRIGLENSASWSEILTAATKNFYDIALLPLWARVEEKLTRSLLRDVDPNPLRFLRFVKDDVRSLAADMTKRTTEAQAAEKYWTVNERRQHTGQEALPDDDERGDEIGSSAPAGGLFGELGTPESDDRPGSARDDGADEDDAEEDEEKAHRSRKARRPSRGSRRRSESVRRQTLWALTDAMTRTFEMSIELYAAQALAQDLASITGRVTGTTKADPVQPVTPERVREIRDAVDAYLEGEAPERWRVLLRPVLEAASRAAAERAAAELGIDFALLQPGLLKFVERETGFLIRHVTATTRDGVRREIASALEAGESIGAMAKRIREAGEFSHDRSVLIARTEATRATNGAARESMSEYAKEHGVRVEKEWLTARDDRVRDEHAAMDGERVAIDDAFSNGLQHPSEPNCRCTLLHHTVVAS